MKYGNQSRSVGVKRAYRRSVRDAKKKSRPPRRTGLKFGSKLSEGLSIAGIEIPMDRVLELTDEIKKMLNYRPRVGILGDTGAGKSSLIRTLVENPEHFAVSDLESCTKEVQEGRSKGDGMIIVDFPGIGESETADTEYVAMYEEYMPTLDFILWVVDGSARNYEKGRSFHEKHFKTLMKKQRVPILIVVSKADKIEVGGKRASDLWDFSHPSFARPKKLALTQINQKVRIVAELFGLPTSQVIPLSSKESWNVDRLVERMMDLLPADKAFPFARALRQEHQNEKTRETVARKTDESILEKIGNALGRVGTVAMKGLVTFIKAEFPLLSLLF